jgi:hypothetical protein
MGTPAADQSDRHAKLGSQDARRGPGRWVAIACQRGCRIKAGAGFRVVAGRG